VNYPVVLVRLSRIHRDALRESAGHGMAFSPATKRGARAPRDRAASRDKQEPDDSGFQSKTTVASISIRKIRNGQGRDSDHYHPSCRALREAPYRDALYRHCQCLVGGFPRGPTGRMVHDRSLGPGRSEFF